MSRPRVFIDGHVGTTGLRIREWLSSRSDIELLQPEESRRKDVEVRRELLNRSDLVILCLPDDAAREAVALIENIQRESLNPIEEALALHRLIDECGLTHQACAESVGRSRAAVSNLLRLLDLDEEVRGMVQGRQIEMGHARALLGAPAESQLRLAKEVVTRGLTVRQTEALVRNLGEPAKVAAPPPPVSDHLVSLGRKLGGRLNAKVELQQKGKGQGRIVINYGSADELEDILRELT